MRNLFALLIASVFLFTACGNDSMFKDEPDLTSVSGVLSAQAQDDRTPGSHILSEQSGDEIPVRSLSINLSDSKYLGNEVQLVGFYDDDEAFEATGITVLEVLNDSAPERLFVPFSSDEIGVQLKYYTDWEIEESKNEVLFQAVVDGEDADQVVITRENFSYTPETREDGSVITALEAYLEEELAGGKDLEERVLGVDSVTAADVSTAQKTVYVLHRPGYIYHIFYFPVSDSPENERIFSEMLAEFRFIPISESTEVDVEAVVPDDDNEAMSADLPDLDVDFSTFESLPYSFRGKYPSNWYYAGSSGGNNVLRHYGFSDEPLADSPGAGELIGLDVMSSEIPDGQVMNFDGKQVTVVSSNGQYTAYISLSDRNYKVYGDKVYSDIILSMAAGLEEIEEEE